MSWLSRKARNLLYVRELFLSTQLKIYGNKVPWLSAQEFAFAPYSEGGKQFSKRIKSAEEKCDCQYSNMVNQGYKLESMEYSFK